MTVATGNWNIFILPYIFSCLYFNKDSYVEIYTKDFIKNEDSFNVLKELFGDSFFLYELPLFDKKRNLPDCAIRFLIEPVKKVDYTYIGDVDILILETNIVDFHKKIIEENGGYFSNIIRPNSKRLTGLHCVKTVPYYEKIKNIKEIINCKFGSDEEMLYEIVDNSIGFLNYKNIERPLHGFHFSLMREPKIDLKNLDKPIWSIKCKKHQQNYLNLKNSKEWEMIYPYFDDRYKKILKLAEENF